MLEILYSMSGSGVCTSVGFLIFLDGIPQPYRISGQLKYFISDTEDFAIVNVFQEDSSRFAFAAIYRNEDGSYTFKEFHQK